MKLLPNFRQAIRGILSLITVSSVFLTSNLMANTCSKADIDYYLQKGFTHQQVVMLCSASAPAATGANTPASTFRTPPVNYNSASAANTQPTGILMDQTYLESALDARNVRLTPTSLSYESKECVQYGYENTLDLSDEACVRSRVTVSLPGLKVISAAKGTFIIRQAEYIVEGDIKREYLNFDRIRRQEKPAVRRLLPNNPKQVNIPLKNNFNPREITNRLSKYINR